MEFTSPITIHAPRACDIILNASFSSSIKWGNKLPPVNWVVVRINETTHVKCLEQCQVQSQG